MKEKSNKNGSDEIIPMNQTNGNSFDRRDSDNDSKFSHRDKRKNKKTRRFLYSILFLIIVTALSLAIGVPSFIFYRITERMQQDFESLNKFAVGVKSDLVEIDIEVKKSRHEIQKLREEMKMNKSGRKNDQFTDASCAFVNYTQIDAVFDYGTDDQRTAAYYQLVVLNEDPCFVNDSVYLYHLAATYYFQGFIAGEDHTLANMQIRRKHLAVANKTITRAILLHGNNSQILKWYVLSLLFSKFLRPKVKNHQLIHMECYSFNLFLCASVFLL